MKDTLANTLAYLYPAIPPDNDQLSSFEYLRRYFPHFRHDAAIDKYIVPIQPAYHRILFPDYESAVDQQYPYSSNQTQLVMPSNWHIFAMRQPSKQSRGCCIFLPSRDERASPVFGLSRTTRRSMMLPKSRLS